MREEQVYQGPRNPDKPEDVRLSILEERIQNLIRTNTETHEELHQDVTGLRNQTHDWMQTMSKSQQVLSERLPVWAISVITLGATAIGAMAMYILTHNGGH